MERVILYVDDASHALAQLAVLRAEGLQVTHWVLVACPPRLTSRISKWVSHSARESWRAKWFARLQDSLSPVLSSAGAHCTPVLAEGSLLALTQQLLLTHGAARVLDLRRPKVGRALEPVQTTRAGEGVATTRRPELSGGPLSVAALLLLAHSMSE